MFSKAEETKVNFDETIKKFPKVLIVFVDFKMASTFLVWKNNWYFFCTLHQQVCLNKGTKKWCRGLLPSSRKVGLLCSPHHLFCESNYKLVSKYSFNFNFQQTSQFCENKIIEFVNQKLIYNTLMTNKLKLNFCDVIKQKRKHMTNYLSCQNVWPFVWKKTWETMCSSNGFF